MNRKEILAELQQWQDTQQALDAQLNLFCDLTRAQPDSDLMTAIYAVAEAHTKAVGKVVGDKSEWMDWFKFENQWGEKALGVLNDGSTRLRPIKTLKQLAWLIAE